MLVNIMLHPCRKPVDTSLYFFICQLITEELCGTLKDLKNLLNLLEIRSVN